MRKPTGSSLYPVLLILTLGCSTREITDAAADDAGQDDGQRPKLPPPEHKPLGAACSAQGDCASGFCVDGVCCDTACDAVCVACNLPNSAGSCTALNDVEDPAPATLRWIAGLRRRSGRRDHLPPKRW
jgi:hypothetical protein